MVGLVASVSAARSTEQNCGSAARPGLTVAVTRLLVYEPDSMGLPSGGCWQQLVAQPCRVSFSETCFSSSARLLLCDSFMSSIDASVTSAAPRVAQPPEHGPHV